MAFGPSPEDDRRTAEQRRADCAKGGGPKPRGGTCPRCGEEYETSLARHLPDCEPDAAGVSDAGPGSELRSDGGSEAAAGDPLDELREARDEAAHYAAEASEDPAASDRYGGAFTRIHERLDSAVAALEVTDGE
jgi:hypothetical protein